MTSLTKINGIGAVYAKKLKEAGLKSAEDFMEKCATDKARQTVADKTGISEKLLETWLTNAQDQFGQPAPAKKAEPAKAEKAAPVPAKKAEPAKAEKAAPAPAKKAEKAAPAPAKKAEPAKAEKAAPAPAKKAEPAKVDPAKEKEAVLAVLDTESQGILNHDLGLLQSIHAPDAVHNDRSGPEWNGWDAISERYSDIFGYGWQSLSLIEPSVEVKGNQATVTHQGVVINDNPTPGQSTYTLQKQDGRWLITRMEYGG